MRFSDVAAGAFGQPYQHNQLDARLLAFAQHFHHRPPPHGPRSSPHGLESSIAVTLLAHAHPHDTQRLERSCSSSPLAPPDDPAGEGWAGEWDSNRARARLALELVRPRRSCAPRPLLVLCVRPCALPDAYV